MKLTRIQEKLLGSVAARPVYDENMVLLVNKGAVFDEALLENLRKRGYKYIYVQEEGTEDIEIVDSFSIETSRSVAKEVGATFNKVRNLTGGEKTTIKAVFNRLDLKDRFKNLMPKGSFRKNVMKFVNDIYFRNTATIGSYSLSMLGANPLSHTLDVTILTVLLAKRFNYSLKEMISLATATLLHDAGMQLFPDVCEKPFIIFTEQDKAIYYQHPVIGFKLLDTLTCFSPMETQTVLQHHENQDGTGFPNGYQGNNDIPIRTPKYQKGFIFRWAEIVAVADRYVNYCSGNLTKEPLNPVAAIKALIEDSGEILNNTVVAEMAKLINIFPLGTPVKIAGSNYIEIIGCQGIVSKENHQSMDKPEVLLLRSRKGSKINPKKVDLSHDRAAVLELNL